MYFEVHWYDNIGSFYDYQEYDSLFKALEHYEKLSEDPDVCAEKIILIEEIQVL